MKIPDYIETELAHWPDIDYQIERPGKHHRVILKFAGKQRFVPFTLTNTDYRAKRNKVKDVRRELHYLGAERAKS